MTARTVKARAVLVRLELSELGPGAVGAKLPEGTLAALVDCIARPMVSDRRAAGVVADALQLLPRPAWVVAVAGAHPVMASELSVEATPQ